MTDTKKLENLISESGLKKLYIANVLGVTRQTLTNKINNESLFTSEEITTLCDLLHIKTLAKKEEIFFAKNVI